jgi:hypothetical protein
MQICCYNSVKYYLGILISLLPVGLGGHKGKIMVYKILEY